MRGPHSDILGEVGEFLQSVVPWALRVFNDAMVIINTRRV